MAGVAEPNSTIITMSDGVDAWDDLAFDPVLTSADTIPINVDIRPAVSPSYPIASVPIEEQMITLCSNGNINMNYRNLEINHRMALAEEQLNHI